jgi:hypothetical protein
MELAALIVGVVSAIALTGTLLLIARQTQSLASQTRLSNELAQHNATNDGMTALRSVYFIFIDHPELRRYFYEGAQLSEAENFEKGELAVRIATVAELLADTLERMLKTAASLSSPDRSAWEGSVADYLSLSPAFRATVAAHPTWWPGLNDRLLKHAPATPPDDD